MAVTNWIKECRDRTWEALRSDVDWRALTAGGTEFRFADDELMKRLEIKPAMCPVTAIGPSGATLPAVETDLKDDEDCRLIVQLVHRGPDAGDCETLLLAFRQALTNHWPTLKTLRSSRLVRVRFEDIRYTMYPDERAMPQMWSVEFTLAFLFEPATS